MPKGVLTIVHNEKLLLRGILGRGDVFKLPVVANVAVFLFAVAVLPASAGTLTPLSYTVNSQATSAGPAPFVPINNTNNFTASYPSNPANVNAAAYADDSIINIVASPCTGTCAQPDPSVSANASASSPVIYGNGNPVIGYSNAASGSISYSYSFEATGPGPSAMVDFDGSLSLTGSGTTGGAYNSSLYIQIENSSGVVVDYFTYTDDQSTPTSVNFSKSPIISTDEVYTVTLEVYAQAVANCSGCSAMASASIDPTITIDPTNTDADDYSLIFSDGLTTPLPSTWYMLLSGFAGLAFFAYRGTKNSSAVISAA